MRSRLAPALAMVVAASCASAQRPRGGERHPKAIVEPPVPAGYVAAVGPLELESVSVSRSEVGWERDFVRGVRVVAYDVVVSQRGAACRGPRVPEATRDARGCEGLETFPSTCEPGPPMRARFEVEVTWAVDVAQRCAGDATPYAIPDKGDARAALSNAGAACFRQRNKLRQESTWTSVYALTELSIAERPVRVETSAPHLLATLLGKGGAPTFCRDDGAYLSGRPGAPVEATSAPFDEAALATALDARAPIGADAAASVPLTAGAWRSEHDLWEACNATNARADLLAQERCQLLRQLDRFLTDVETTARQQTPRGLGLPPTAEPSASASTGSRCAEPRPASSAGGTCTSETSGGKP